jgi:hypothetical protein
MSDDRDEAGFRVTDRRRVRADETTAGVAEQTDTDAAASGSEEGPGSAEQVSFSTFVLGLSTQALLHLGEIDDPTAGGRATDLGAAKHMIDILGVLDAKTRGNLDHAEEQLLGAVLYDLRMRYVELVRKSKA